MQCLLAATVLCLALPASWQGGDWSLQVRAGAGRFDVCVQRHDELEDHCVSRLSYWLADAQLPFPVIRLRSFAARFSRLQPTRAPGQPAAESWPPSAGAQPPIS